MPRSVVSGMRARSASEHKREQAALRSGRAFRSSGPAGEPVPARPRRGTDDDAPADDDEDGAAAPAALPDRATRLLAAQWEPAGRLLRRLAATPAGSGGGGDGDGSSSSSDDDSSSSSDEDGAAPHKRAPRGAAAAWAAPAALALDPGSSDAAVLDGDEVRLYKWLPKMQVWMRRGRDEAQLGAPSQGVAMLGSGEIAVAHARRGCVVVLGPGGIEVRTIGRGLTRGSLSRPSALASDADSDTLAVLDSDPVRLQLHRASTGALLRTFALDSLGVRTVPTGGLAIDGTGHVLVCDPDRRRVLRLRVFDGGCAAQLGAGKLTCPTAVAAMADGTVLVGDDGSIQVFRSDGSWLCSVAVGRGGSANSLSRVTALAMDAAGQLLVSQSLASGEGGSVLLLSGPATAEAVRVQYGYDDVDDIAVPAQAAVVPAAQATCTELPSVSDATVRRRRRVALLLKQQFLSALIDRKLTLRGLFPVTNGSDGQASAATNGSSHKVTIKEQQVDAMQLGLGLKRLGLAATKDELEELVCVLSACTTTNLVHDDFFAEVQELPQVRFVSFRLLEQLKAAMLPAAGMVAAAAKEPTAMNQKPQNACGGVENAAALRKLRALVALSPWQQNERKQWERYDKQMEAAVAADRKTPGLPSALVPGASPLRSDRGRVEGKPASPAEGLLANYVAVSSPRVAAERDTAIARETLLALSFDSPRAEE